MPLFDFSCAPCKLVFDEQAIAGPDGVPPVPCPSCGEPSVQVWIKAPGMAADGNMSAEERTAAFLRFGRDPSSRAELSRMKSEAGDMPVGRDAIAASQDRKPTKFRLTEQQRREAIERVRANRAKGAHDAWRMPYTKDPEIIKAGQEAAKELSNVKG